MVAKTKERLELFRQLWPAYVRTDEIIDRLNALDGDHVRKDYVRQWASEEKIKRCPEMLTLELEERANAYEIAVRGNARDMNFGGLVFTPDWPKETVIRLINEWEKGTTTLELQRIFRRSKNSLVGKIHRLAERGLLKLRGSPIIRDLDDPRRNPDPNRRNVPRPKITLTPVSVERKVFVMPVVPVRPPPVAPVQAFVPPSRKCLFPMWGDNAKPDHRYCDEPAVLRSYCARHAKACYVFVRPFKDAA